MNTTITQSHQSKPAYIYVRQSTPSQVRHNQESTERQYALQDKALAMGWPQRSIRVLDRDLGRSGAQSAGREDFKTLVADVSMGQVGAVFALEVSRLARSNLDWHRLLELCALTRTLVIDADGCYDPADFNDGLVLGIKGTMAQAELHLMRGRLLGGKLNKAQKGELRVPLPIGFCYGDEGRIVVDPDEEIRGAVQMVFRLFKEGGSAYSVVQRFVQDGLRFPKRAYGGASSGKPIWGDITNSRVASVLKNPSYAGTYVYGRYRCSKIITAEGEVRKSVRAMPVADWRVHMPDHHEGYITVEEFEQNQQRLASNLCSGEGTVLNGAAREGLALLQGLLVCSKCGHAVSVHYQGNGGIYPTYECTWLRRHGTGIKSCIAVRTDVLDAGIAEEVFKALKPAELELALGALNELEQRDQAIMRQWNMHIERAAYECSLAERRYEEVDPSNRLVASSLEQRWNTAMVNLETIKAEATTFQNQKARVVSDEQRTKIMALARDLPRVWRSATTQPKDRKRMLRLLIRDITVERLAESRTVVMHVRWQGGSRSDTTVELPLPLADRVRCVPQTVGKVRDLARTLSDRQIVDALNQQGLRNTHGQPFKLAMVRWIRYRYNVPSFCVPRPDELSVRQLAERLEVSLHFINYWIQKGLIRARKLDGRGPWWITISDQQEQQLRDRVRASAHLNRLLVEP
jgi:DNA invertase Pin-like site-specific DNA recombinase